MAKLYSALHENLKASLGKERPMTFLQALCLVWRDFERLVRRTWGGVMGGKFVLRCLAQVTAPWRQPPQDTRLAVKALGATNIILFFVGGDGTAKTSPRSMNSPTPVCWACLLA